MSGHYPGDMTVHDLEPKPIEWPDQAEQEYFCTKCEINTETQDECPVCNSECEKID